MFAFMLDVLTLLRKESLMTFKDKKGRIILIMPIIAQTLLFGYVATYDLNRVDYALLDEDHSQASRVFTRHFDGSGIFRRIQTLESSRDVSAVLDGKEALLVVHIGPDFERQLNSGRYASVQIIVDGRNSNVAGTAANYAANLIESFNTAQQQDKGIPAAPLRIVHRAWFNPNMETRWNIMAGLMAVLAVVQSMTLAGQSVAREKEQGTFDQLLVTPLGPMTLMLGKALPPAFVGVLQASIILVISLYWFRIPFAGSFVLLYIGLILFSLAVVGIGLCVSTLASTMQQAMLYSFALFMPMVLLSGFTTPVASMPPFLQYVTLLNPVRYGVEFTQRIYLEGAGLAHMFPVFAPLGLMAMATLGLASWLFRHRLD